VYLKSVNEQTLFLAAQNSGALLSFTNTSQQKMISLQPGDAILTYYFRNGTSRKEEVYYGNSFYSQSGRYILAGPAVKSVTITDRLENKRDINF
jgi:enediyne biosynthesis protein E4